VPALVILYSIFYFKKSFFNTYIIVIAALLIVFFLLSFILKNATGPAIKKTVSIINITYLLLELCTYSLVSFGIIRADMRFFGGGIEATDQKLAQYDSISGYRAVPGYRRYLSIDNGKIEIDLRTKINKSGWYSTREYHYKKADTKIKRYMVLGDSYSSGIAVPVAWPDIAQSIFEKNGNDSIELYNFSLEGTGLSNWYRIFFYEIIPKYDFDGVIIASSSERNDIPDFDRKFMMMQSYDDATYIKSLDILIQPVPTCFPKDSAPPIFPIYTSQELDRIKDTYMHKRKYYFHAAAPDLWFLAIFYGVTDGFRKMDILNNRGQAYNKPYDQYYALAGKPYKMEYFDSRFKYAFMLKDIIGYCKKNKKDIILAGIPDRENAQDYVTGKPVICRQEIEFLAAHYNIKQFDGFQIFKGKNEAFVDKAFYEYDGHWNKPTVNLFARELVESGVLNTK
jgi:hypothetical protein